MASGFGEDAAMQVFTVIDVNSNSRLSKSELQTYCASNNIQWSSVFTAMELHKVNDVTKDAFLAAAAAGKLGMFAGVRHGLAARNIASGRQYSQPSCPPSVQPCHHPPPPPPGRQREGKGLLRTRGPRLPLTFPRHPFVVERSSFVVYVTYKPMIVHQVSKCG